MKAMIRGIGLALMVSVLAGLSGCGADNESEAQKLQSAQGAAPTPANSQAGEVASQAKSYDEYAQQQQKLSSDPKKADYVKALRSR